MVDTLKTNLLYYGTSQKPFRRIPQSWGGGVAHSVLILSLVIAFGIILAKIKIAGISLGHMDTFRRYRIRAFQPELRRTSATLPKGIRIDIICLLHRFTGRARFLFRFLKGGFTLNMLAMTTIFLSVVITIILHFATGVPITTMVGILFRCRHQYPGIGCCPTGQQ